MCPSAPLQHPFVLQLTPFKGRGTTGEVLVQREPQYLSLRYWLRWPRPAEDLNSSQATDGSSLLQTLFQPQEWSVFMNRRIDFLADLVLEVETGLVRGLLTRSWILAQTCNILLLWASDWQEQGACVQDAMDWASICNRLGILGLTRADGLHTVIWFHQVL